MALEDAVDVAVVGAGIAGLICAQQLQHAGYRVIVVEKSRGLGGRLATRRLHHTCADHGVRSLNVQGKLSQHLIQALLTAEVIHPWTDGLKGKGSLPEALPQPDFLQSQQHYAAESGLTAVAKFLAAGLEIWRGQRVQALEANHCWHLTLEASGVDPMPPLSARSVVMAIPAPQAVTLLEPLFATGFPADLIQQLQSVQFDPCITAIATYPPEKQSELKQLPWLAKLFTDTSDASESNLSPLAWLSIENTKRWAEMPVVIAQSTAEFAEHYLEAQDLQFAGQQLLDAAANLAGWLHSPVELQVHRWRYAFVRQPLPKPYLATALPLPLACSGDWCGGRMGRYIEGTLESGLAAASQIAQLLEHPTEMPTPASATGEEKRFQQLLHLLKASWS